MTTDARTLTTHEAITPDWETVKAWAKDTFTRERIQGATLCGATVSLIGVVLFSLHTAMENRTILLSLHNAMENYISLGF